MLGVVITALNLRLGVIAVSPLLDEIRADTGISSTLAGMLTTLPVLCFGMFSPLAPRLAHRFGLDATLIGALVLLGIATLLRSVSGLPLLYLGAGLMGMAIAIGNVLLPASIKRDFPHRSGLMTGLLTMALSASGAIGAGFSIPLQEATGASWRGTLALWAVPVVATVAVMLPRLRIITRSDIGTKRVRVDLWRDPVAWAVTGMMGLQSFSFYALAAWMPTIMVDNGLSHGRAGFLLSLSQFAGFVSSFLVPVFASRRRQQVPYVVGTVIVWFVSLLGLAISPTGAPELWVILWGLAAGSALSISLAFFTLRSPDIHHAAQLSGMAQTVGYVVAATGPFIVGFLHDASGGWNVSLVFLMSVLLVMGACGVQAARDRQVGGAR